MARVTGSAVDIAIVCSDFEGSLRFYRDLLGLPVFKEVEIPGEVALQLGLAPRGFRQVRLKAGNTLIKLMDITDPPGAIDAAFSAGVRWITFFVDDVPAIYRDWKAKGVSFLSDLPDAGTIICAVDPNGVIVELIQQ
ncbi:MAG: glyoxalase [Phycisphaeraceae bacterium]|nr:glyoxalase [Phycisphaeraceae bacterium]